MINSLEVFGGICLAAVAYSIFMIIVHTDWSDNPKDKRSIDQMMEDYKANQKKIWGKN